MTYTNRKAAEALIPEATAKEILQNVPEQSKFLQLATRTADMSTKTVKRPVLESLPMAYFVDQTSGDTNDDDIGYKKTTSMEWGNLNLVAEEIACIVPIPENVIDDADYDLWGEYRPQIEAAFGVVIDQAAFFGVNKPASWGTAIVPGAISAGNTLAINSLTGKDLASHIIGEGGLMEKVELDGYEVNGFYAASSMKAKLRDLRTQDGALLYLPSLTTGTPSTINGEPAYFDKNGVFNNSALMIAGDWSKAVWAMRQDMTFKILDQAVIQDPSTKEIVYNLAQQDMVALRCKMRLAVQTVNPINRMNTDKTTRYPFAVLTPAGA